MAKEYYKYKSRLYLEGAFSFANFTLLNGIFLIGFAITLNANHFQLGVLLAIPLFANLLQLFSAFILEAIGTKKWTAVAGLMLARLSWVLAILIAFGFFRRSPVYMFMYVLVISSFFFALGNLALLSWIKDLIPTERLGRFLGKRNIYASIGGIIVYLAGSYVIDAYSSTYAYGYIFLFALAIGMTAILFFKGIPEKKRRIRAVKPRVFLERLRLPVSDKKFIPLIHFGLVWGFSVNFAAPFFIIYLVEDLGVSFLFISLFLVIDTLFRIYGLSLWRQISDEYGAKPTLVVSATITSIIPLAFLFVNKSSYLLVPIIFIVSAAAYAGVDIALGQLLFKSSPRKYSAYYISTFSSLAGFCSALALILAGIVSTIINDSALAGYLAPLKYVFFFSFLLRTSSLPLILKLREPKAREIGDMLNRLKTLRFASFIVSFYSLSDYTSKLVLFPQKQLFILQRRMVARLRRDVGTTRLLLSKIADSLGKVTERNVGHYQARFRKLHYLLSNKAADLEYAKPTIYQKIPQELLARFQQFDMTRLSNARISPEAQRLKNAVAKSKKRLERIAEKRLGER